MLVGRQGRAARGEREEGDERPPAEAAGDGAQEVAISLQGRDRDRDEELAAKEESHRYEVDEEDNLPARAHERGATRSVWAARPSAPASS